MKKITFFAAIVIAFFSTTSVFAQKITYQTVLNRPDKDVSGEEISIDTLKASWDGAMFNYRATYRCQKTITGRMVKIEMQFNDAKEDLLEKFVAGPVIKNKTEGTFEAGTHLAKEPFNAIITVYVSDDDGSNWKLVTIRSLKLPYSRKA